MKSLHAKKTMEMIARRICPRDIRRGRRILRGVLRLFKSRNGKFEKFDYGWNIDAMVFSGTVGGGPCCFYISGLQWLQLNGVPGRVLIALKRNFAMEGERIVLV